MRPSVIVPARDAAATLLATLDALRDQGAGEVLVVDDASTDATRELARGHDVVTRVVEAPGTGPGGARNAGAAAATGDVLVFLDADCVPAPGWLAAGLRALEDADLVQGRVDPAGAVGPYDRTLSVTADWGLFESANLFVRRELFERVGGFDDWLRAPAEHLVGVTVREKGLGEDVLLGWSARRAGARTAFAPDARVAHAVFSRGPRSFVAERLRLRHFPAIARRVPELRGTFFFGRVFLTRRTAALDAAVAAVATAAAVRRPWPLLATLPYLRLLHAGAGGHRRALAVHLAADVVGAVALARGSVRNRTPVL